MKRVVKYISEIIFAFVLIFTSYFAWDRLDVEAYEKYITQYSLNDIQIDVENDFSELAYLSDEDKLDNTVLYVNNYQDKVYDANIFMVLTGTNDEMLDDLYLSINGEKHLLNDIYVSDNENDYYFLISNVNLNEYEKVSYNLKLLIRDEYDFGEWTNFSYKFVEEIKG